MTTTWTCTKHVTAQLTVNTTTNSREWTVAMGEPCLLGQVEMPTAGPYRYCDFVEGATSA